MHSLSKLVVLVVVSLGLTAFADEPEDVSVEVGGKFGIMLKGVKRVAIGDPSIADVNTEPGGVVVVTGVKVGTTTMLLWASTDETRQEYRVIVTAKGTAKVEPPKTAPLRTGRSLTDTETSLAVNETLVRDSKNVKRVAIGDPTVADVHVDEGGMSITGIKAGKTTLLIWLKDGTQLEFHLTVR